MRMGLQNMSNYAESKRFLQKTSNRRVGSKFRKARVGSMVIWVMMMAVGCAQPVLKVFPPQNREVGVLTLNSLVELPVPGTLPDEERVRTLDPWASDDNRYGLPIGLSGVGSFEGWVNATVGGTACKYIRDIPTWEPDGGGSVGMVCEGLPEGECGEVVGVEVWFGDGGEVVSVELAGAVKFDDLSAPMVVEKWKIADGVGGGPSLNNEDSFGFSVARIADVDDDGIPSDIAVGAIWDNTGGSDRGAVYIMSLSIDGTAHRVVKIADGVGGGPRLGNYDEFGFSVAWIGDLNGDGLPFGLAVGARRDDTGGTDRGAVYIMSILRDGTAGSVEKIAHGVGGGPSLSDGDIFGSSIAWIGEIHGKLTNIAVGARMDDTSGTDRGAVYILSLSSVGTVYQVVMITDGFGGGPVLSNDDQFGVSVAWLGFASEKTTVAVGATHDDTGGTNRGAVYIMSILRDGTADSWVKIADGVGGGPSLSDGDELGFSIAWIGDVDGDGISSDIAVGAQYDDTGGSDCGTVYLMFLLSSGTAHRIVKIASGVGGGPSLNSGDLFGRSLAWIGNVNGDGISSHIAVGARSDDTGGPDRGAIHILSLADLTDAATPPTIEGAVVQPQTISSGALHLISSRPTPAALLSQLDPHASDPSRSILYFSVLTSTFNASHTLTALNASIGGRLCGSTQIVPSWPASQNTRRIGISCEGVPEGVSGKVVDGEVWVRDTTQKSYSIKGYGIATYEDLSAPMVVDLWKIADGVGGGPNLNDADHFGYSAAWIGDVNGDGVSSDIAIGARLDDAGGEDSGSVYIMSLLTNGTAQRIMKIANGVGGGLDLGYGIRFGSSVAWIGDIDGDGLSSDIAVGAYWDGGNLRGAIFILSLSLEGVAHRVVKIGDRVGGGPTLGSYNRFGVSVAWIGDVDGDGVSSDIVVGASHDDTGGDSFGAVYIMSLLPDGTAHRAVKIADGVGGGPSLADHDYFGGGVAWIGDINSDRQSDIIIGAYGDSTGGSNCGAVYIMSLLDSGSAEITAKIANGLNGGPILSSSSWFGISVAWIGDLDGDGLWLEVAVGAVKDGPEHGAMYILFLSADGTVHREVKISDGIGGGPSLSNGDWFGISLAWIGDVAGDGMSSNLAVGSIHDDTGGSDRGAVYILSLADLTDVHTPPTIEGAAMPQDISSGAFHLISSHPTPPAPLPELDPHASDPSRSTLYLSVLTSTFNASHTLTVLNTSIGGRLCGSTQIIPSWPASQNTRRIGISCEGVPEGESGKVVDGEVWVRDTTQKSYSIRGFGIATYEGLSTPIVVDARKIADGVGGGPSLGDRDAFGTSLAWIGDVDGDGISSDIAVGAEADDTGGSDRGAVYIISLLTDGTSRRVAKIANGVGGGPILGDSDRFGCSVAWIGDVDRDGLSSDIAVGAYADDTGGSSRGAVYIMSLLSNGAAYRAVKIADGVGGGPSLSDNDRFGWSVAWIGDVSGDGLSSDIAVGADGDNSGGYNRGAVYTMSLLEDGTAYRVVKIADGVGGGPNLKNSEHFGFSVACVGDVDKVGSQWDIAIGTQRADTVYIVSLSLDRNAHRVVKIADGVGGGPRLHDGDFFGNSLAWIGDLDGDGLLSDIAVGARNGETGGTDRGAVYFMSLSLDGTAHRVVKIAGSVSGGPRLLDGDFFGSSLAWVGDVSGNGLSSSLAVGTRFDDSGGPDRGAVYILSLADQTDAATPPTIEGAAMPQDISSGAFHLISSHPTPPSLLPQLDPHASDPSRSTLYFSVLTSTFNASQNLEVVNASIGGRICASTKIIPSWPQSKNTRRLGISCAGVPEGVSGEVVDGEVWVQSTTKIYSIKGCCIARYDDLSAPMVVDKWKASSSPSSTFNFGSVLAWIGDVDRDGIASDIAVGASGDDTGGFNRGAVFIMSLSSDGTAHRVVKIADGVNGGPSLTDGDEFGFSVAWLGDIDGNGLSSDIAVGAYLDDSRGVYRGAVYILSLSSDSTAHRVVKIADDEGGGPSLNDEDRFGVSVACIGDVDEDGISSDIAVGALYDDTGGTDRGALYILSLSLDGTAHRVVKIASGVSGGPSLRNEGQFGRSVAWIGDVENDENLHLGIAAGAHNDDTGGSSRGAIYILYLSSTGVTHHVVKIADGMNGGPSLSNGDFFGISVTWIGDVDRDGLSSDIAVGSWRDSEDRGCVYILSLSVNGMVHRVVKIADGTNGGPRLNIGDEFGLKVAWIGDINGDGVLSELAVSARGVTHILSLADLTDVSTPATIEGGMIPFQTLPRSNQLISSHPVSPALRLDPHASDSTRSTLYLSVLTDQYDALNTTTISSVQINHQPCVSFSKIMNGWPASNNTRRIGISCDGVPPGSSEQYATVEVKYFLVGDPYTRKSITTSKVAIFDNTWIDLITSNSSLSLTSETGISTEDWAGVLRVGMNEYFVVGVDERFESFTPSTAITSAHHVGDTQNTYLPNTIVLVHSSSATLTTPTTPIYDLSQHLPVLTDYSTIDITPYSDSTFFVSVPSENTLYRFSGAGLLSTHRFDSFVETANLGSSISWLYLSKNINGLLVGASGQSELYLLTIGTEDDLKLLVQRAEAERFGRSMLFVGDLDDDGMENEYLIGAPGVGRLFLVSVKENLKVVFRNHNLDSDAMVSLRAGGYLLGSSQQYLLSNAPKSLPNFPSIGRMALDSSVLGRFGRNVSRALFRFVGGDDWRADSSMYFDLHTSQPIESIRLNSIMFGAATCVEVSVFVVLHQHKARLQCRGLFVPNHPTKVHRLRHVQVSYIDSDITYTSSLSSPSLGILNANTGLSPRISTINSSAIWPSQYQLELGQSLTILSAFSDLFTRSSSIFLNTTTSSIVTNHQQFTTRSWSSHPSLQWIDDASFTLTACAPIQSPVPVSLQTLNNSVSHRYFEVASPVAIESFSLQNSTVNTPSIYGGDVLEIVMSAGVAYNLSNHPCDNTWQSWGLSKPTSPPTSTNVTFWIFVGSQPCLDVAWTGINSTLTCSVPPGLGKDIDLTVVIAGQSINTSISYADPPPITYVSWPSSNILPRTGLTNLTFGGSEFLEYLFSGGDSLFEFSHAQIGPWKLENGTFVDSNLTNLALPPGLGSNLVAQVCATFEGVIMCSSEDGAPRFSFGNPTISDLIPNDNLNPFAENIITMTALNIGAQSILDSINASIQVLVGGRSALRVTRTTINPTTDEISFVTPQVQDTRTGVVLNVVGAESNSLSIGFSQRYIIAFSPRRVLPSQNGALEYSFSAAVIGISDDTVTGMRVAGINCPSVRRGVGILVECEGLRAPAVWTSDVVQIVVQGPNNTVITTPVQSWLSPLPPPQLINIGSLSSSYPTTGGSSIVLTGRGLGLQSTDVLLIEWGSEEKGWKTSMSGMSWKSEDEVHVTLPSGTGRSCARVQTRGRLYSSPICFNYDKPRVIEVEPTFALVGDRTSSWRICGSNFGSVIANVEVEIGGVECGRLRFLGGCLVCSSLDWRMVRGGGGNQTRWVSENGVVVRVSGQESALFGMELLKAPEITGVIPTSAGEGDVITVTVSGLTTNLTSVAGVLVAGENCLEVAWVIPGQSLRCRIPNPHPLWEDAQNRQLIVPAIDVRVGSAAGVWSEVTSSSQFEPLGLRARPSPSLNVEGIVSWRPLGQPRTLFVRWRYPGLWAEAEVLYGSTIAPITAFDIEASSDSTFTTNIESSSVLRDSSRTQSSTPSRTNLVNDSTAWDWHEAKFTVASDDRLHVRVRARNADGNSEWVDQHGPGTPQACIQDQYLTTNKKIQTCVTCPEEAECAGLGFENITAKQGFWRVPWDTEQVTFAQCIQENACLGWSGQLLNNDGSSSNAPLPPYALHPKNNFTSSKQVQQSWIEADQETLLATRAVPGLQLIASDHEGCAKWHHGVLCDACSEGSYAAIGGGCNECGEPGWIAGRLVLLVCVMGLILCVLLWSAWKTRGQSSSREVMIAKLLFTHFQTVAIVGSIDLRWPRAVRGFFDVINAAASATTSGLALECLMGKSAEDPLARTGLIYSAPLWLFSFAALMWLIHGLCVSRFTRVRETSKPTARRPSQRSTSIVPQTSLEDRTACCRAWSHETRHTVRGFDFSTFQEQMYVSAVVLLFLIHTPISSAAVRLMACRPIGPQDASIHDDRVHLRLVMDMNYRCKGDFLWKMLVMGMPVLFLFSFGLPVLFAYVLKQQGQRKRQNHPLTRSRLGFLYLGYTEKQFYWESVVLIRKVMIAMVTVLLGPYGGGIQALTALLLVLFSLVLHSWAKPYELQSLNRLEMFALVVAAVTLVGGIYVVLEEISSPLGESSVGVVASIAIVGSNVVLVLVAMSHLNRALRERWTQLQETIAPYFQAVFGRDCCTRDDPTSQNSLRRRSSLGTRMWRRMSTLQSRSELSTTSPTIMNTPSSNSPKPKSPSSKKPHSHNPLHSRPAPPPKPSSTSSDTHHHTNSSITINPLVDV